MSTPCLLPPTSSRSPQPRLRRLRVLALLAATLLARPLPGATADAPKPAAPRPAALPVAELKHDDQVDFEKEILPFLKNNCLACHNTTKAKGGLNLETPPLILKGGDTGPAVKPGQSAESLMFKAAAHLDSELIMPPRDNKANASDLRPEQLALLKLWIDQGARGEVHASTPVHWLEQPPRLDPIFAVALTRDSQFVACARGNRITVYHLPSGQVVAHLADPALAAIPGFNEAAHRDWINSLAFNPEGTLLASSAFREAKIWRRPQHVRKPSPAITEPFTEFALSADRRWLATATPDHHIALYDLAGTNAASPARILTGHSNLITALSFSADHLHLASVSLDRTIRWWDVRDGKAGPAVTTSNTLHAVSWLPDPARVAAGSAEGTVLIYKTDPEPALQKEWKGHTGAVRTIAALPGGHELLTAGDDGVIRRWNVDEGKVAKEYKQDAAVLSLAVRPDGKRFAAAGTNRVARLWDTDEGKVVADLKGDRYAYELVAETERSLTVAKATTEFNKKTVDSAEAEFKKQSDRVATATATNTLTEKIFLEKEKTLKEAQQARTTAEKDLHELVASIQKTISDFEDADRKAKEATAEARRSAEKASQAQLAAERASLARTDAEKTSADAAAVAARTKATANSADAAKETARRIAEESAGVAEKSHAFAEAVAADATAKSKLSLDARSAAEKAIEQVALLSFAAGQLKPAYDKTLAEAPDKRKQATNRVEIAGKAVGEAENEFKRAETRKSVTGHELELATQSAGRSSNTLVAAKSTLERAQDGEHKLNDALARARTDADAAEQPLVRTAFSPDGRILATRSQDGRVQTWSGESGAAIERFPAPAGDQAKDASGGKAAAGLSFLDNHTLLAQAGMRTFATWELSPAWTLDRTLGTGEAESPLSDRVNVVRFSPDGQLLATGGGEPTRSGEIKLWKVADGSLHRDLTNVHSDAVLSLDFSPDGRHLATSAADRFVRVTDLATGRIVRAFEGHTSYVLGVAWKGDSRTLASAGADNVIKIWDFTTGERRKNIEGATKEVTSIAFVGVSDQTVATSGDSQVRLIKENGDKVRSFDGSADFMNAAAATPDGRIVVAGGQDGVLRVWSGMDGKALTNFSATAP